MNSTAFILTLAYPETIVQVADEWYSPFLKYLGIGKTNYVKAGHAALVLINKKTGILEYHDFGRYITPEPYGRVRGKDTDCELNFPLKAEIQNNEILNLNELLIYLATHPKFTHGEGELYASVCSEIDYNKAREYITTLQRKDFIRYAAFIKKACNCARFVTDTLIASTINLKCKKRLQRSKWFTPSPLGNVVLANTESDVFLVSEEGIVTTFKGCYKSENKRFFLDRLQNFEPNFVGTLKPKPVASLDKNAQWLSGIAAGAWFQIQATTVENEYQFQRISPYGNVDVNAVYKVNNSNFNSEQSYQFIHYSNCAFFHITQRNTVFKFERIS